MPGILDSHVTALQLLRNLRGSRERILAFQTRHLRRVVAHAYENVPYYRELFDRRGLRPDDIRTAADLVRLPVTDKADLHHRPIEDVLAHGVEPHRLLTRATGGSSGEPLVVRRTHREERLLNVVRRRTGRYHGYDMREPLVVVSAPREEYAPRRNASWYVMRALGLFQSHHVSCLQPVETIAEELSRIQPGLLGGYPGVLARVARHVLETGRDDIRPRYVATGGEVRTPEMRELIAAAFRAPVYDTYGSHEFSRLGWECRDTGDLHVCDDSVILEVLGEDGRPVAEGERGEVVATALHSYAMPFIRYRLGDVVTKGTDVCVCGAPFSTISAIQGRMVDYFQLPGGRLLHPYRIAGATVEAIRTLTNDARRHTNPFPWLREYQYVQEREDRVVLYYVPLETPPDGELAAVARAVRELLGADVEFEMVRKDRLLLEDNGKFRVYRSLVASAYDRPAKAAAPPARIAVHAAVPPAPALPAFDVIPDPIVKRGGRHVAALKRVADLSERERDGMFALLVAHYDRVTRYQFEADIHEKEWVIFKTEDSEVVGFSTLMRIRADVDGERLLAFYSGDTIVRPDRWGAVVTPGIAFFVRHIYAHVALYPELRHVYFHVAGTHRGYLMVPGLFRVSRPRFDHPLTPDAARILGALSRVKHLAYDPARSIVRFDNPTVLRGGVADLSERDLENPHVAWYAAQNPGFVQGDRLASLVVLSLDNLTPAARRMLDDAAAGTGAEADADACSRTA